MWAKQSTAATLIVGPILDSAGAEYTSAVIGDLSISKNGGNLTALAAAATLTHIANGQYTLVLTTGNMDTLGRAQITCNKATYQMPEVRLMVVPAMVFDSIVLGSDYLQIDVVQFAGTNLTAAAGIPEVKVASIATDAVNANALAANAVTEIQSGLATQSSVDAVQADTNDIQTRLPAALVGGKMNSIAELDSATQAQIDAIEDALVGLAGTGARTVTITVNDGTTPLQNATVRLTEGVNTFRALTNASGVATFNLDDATYTVAITKSGYSYAGTTLVVDGTETRTYSMTVVTVTPPDDPALCAVTFHLRDQYGANAESEPVEITFVKWESGAAETPPVVSVPPVQTTDANGLVEVELYRDATYRIVYGTAGYARRIDVVVPDASSYTVEI